MDVWRHSLDMKFCCVVSAEQLEEAVEHDEMRKKVSREVQLRDGKGQMTVIDDVPSQVPAFFLLIPQLRHQTWVL